MFIILHFFGLIGYYEISVYYLRKVPCNQRKKTELGKPYSVMKLTFKLLFEVKATTYSNMPLTASRTFCHYYSSKMLDSFALRLILKIVLA